MLKNNVFDVAMRLVAGQLGGPSGPLGSVVARVLNRGNAPTIAAAVAALELSGTETVADVGFGGGLGLDLLLQATDDVVHGIEPSIDMLKRARRAHVSEVHSGRLRLDAGAMDSLPIEDAALDAWISLNTIYFIPDLVPAFAELRRVLKPSGRGVLGVADPEWLGRQPFAKHGFVVRPVEDVVSALAGEFDVEKRTVAASKATGGGGPYNLLICRPR